MPEFVRFLSTLREQMSAELTRSDVLRALIWPNAGLLLAIIGVSTGGGQEWLLRTLTVLLCGFMALYAAAYVFFALTDSDALRSEKYKLQKMAIEHGVFGDDRIGLIDVPPRGGDSANALPLLANADETQ